MVKFINDMTDEEIGVETGALVARLLLLLEAFAWRHPELPMWHLLGIALRDGLQTFEAKRQLFRMPPATKQNQ